MITVQAQLRAGAVLRMGHPASIMRSVPRICDSIDASFGGPRLLRIHSTRDFRSHYARSVHHFGCGTI